MHERFSALAAWVTSVVQTGGPVGVAGLTLLEPVFPPIPSELILPLAGFLVGQGRFAFAWVVAAATVGSLGGALVRYWLGYTMGEQRLRGFLEQYGRWLCLRESDVERSREWFDRHGGKAVLLGRLVPAVRSLISIPAGLDRMPLVPFALYTAVGSGLWNAALVAAGWLLGSQWERVEPYLQAFEYAALAALAAGIAAFFWQRRRGPEADEGTPRRRGSSPATP
jgi:membrane protein DedA with SNARE-associated domain